MKHLAESTKNMICYEELIFRGQQKEKKNNKRVGIMVENGEWDALRNEVDLKTDQLYFKEYY